MSAPNRYNGWRNYETWRVNLEMFDGYDPEEFVHAAGLQETAEETIESQSSGLALDYALSFLSEVDWQEIADAINEAYDYAEDDDDAEDDDSEDGEGGASLAATRERLRALGCDL